MNPVLDRVLVVLVVDRPLSELRTEGSWASSGPLLGCRDREDGVVATRRPSASGQEQVPSGVEAETSACAQSP